MFKDPEGATAKIRPRDGHTAAFRASSNRVIRRSDMFIGAISDYHGGVDEMLVLALFCYRRSVFASLKDPTLSNQILMSITITTTMGSVETTNGSVY